jgi:hypothetical protein
MCLASASVVVLKRCTPQRLVLSAVAPACSVALSMLSPEHLIFDLSKLFARHTEETAPLSIGTPSSSELIAPSLSATSTLNYGTLNPPSHGERTARPHRPNVRYNDCQ